jgi:serine/threonine protein kinase
MSDMVGQHIGKYRVTHQLGRGGMGTVYAALDETLHREVAVKVLNAGLDDPTVARRFRAEAVTVARLNHSGIATIYELLHHDEQWLMVMELVRGETLEQAMAGHGALPLPRAADVAMQMLNALAHAHGLGVIHRDLKPANVMLMPGGAVKIMDFGIARVAGGEQLTTAGFMMGTPAYMAPEQVMGREVDARSDLYAVGLVLFQMVTGELPFKGKTPVQVAQARINETPVSVGSLRPDLPAWIGQVVDIALAREPEKRFRSAVLFRDSIRRGLDNLPIEPPEPIAEDLAMTAAPGSLRLIKSDSQAPAAAPAPAPTLAEPPAAPSLPQAVSEGAARSPSRSFSAVAIAGAAVLVAAVAVTAWWMMRPSPGPTSAEISAGPVAEAMASGPVTDQTGQHSAAAAAPPAATAPGVPPVATRGTGPLPAATPSIVAGRATAAPAAVAGSRAGTAPAGTAPASRGPAVPAPPPALFRGIRGFVLNGQRAEEKPAVLSFADGRVTLFDESGTSPLTSMPYQQITSAAYTRARNPRWYPTLAGPPIDVDMPGGLFRGDRHWLALQSRDAWMIVRMNDGDRQPITEAVTTFLGLKVDELQR